MGNFSRYFFLYLVIVFFSLFVFFFVGFETNKETGEENLVLKSDGINDFKKGLDIAGGVRLNYKIDYSRYDEIYDDQVQLAQIKSDVEGIILSTIDERISTLGVSDYTSYIQTIGNEDFVVVEIGGVSDVDTAKEIIGKTVQLEFKVPYDGTNDQELKQGRREFSEDIILNIVQNDLSMEEVFIQNVDNNFGFNTYSGTGDSIPQFINDRYEDIVSIGENNIYPNLINNDESETWNIVRYSGKNKSEEDQFDVLEISYYPSWITAVDPKTNKILNAAFFNYASVGTSQIGKPVVQINFNSMGGQIFCNITANHVDKQMAIFVGGQLITAPVINEQICGGTAQIDGNFDSKSARELAKALNDGAMPAPLILSYEEIISPTIGEDAFKSSVIAGIIGFSMLFIFMISFYGIKYGVVAIISLLSFIIILLALIKLLGYALSLSGIAAIILSIGIAVDANVLIFERIKEELKLGKGFLNSIKDGFSRSLSAIRDGNLTTGIIGFLLFMGGTNVFKGFGTMMLINIILILIVVVPLTKILLDIFHIKNNNE
ncbi:protein translocase subunit SecD [Candidatus Vampirococcus lugosii]|uniref:Preprotein translocase subunit SecD n=1 Tax=Candidatus Vampirococcus lugosii TaxID=2789015 RepID=A0ABS5QJJ9_9BACT|nr:protein translocase subunit SecD [Candidatus Vampirococcus lugosii]MBS8121457.1 preprotein translocase subunit SecD [Candidatus Vampirococcus lugosii]